MKKSLGIIFALVTLFAVVPNALALTKAFQVNTASGGTLTTGLVSYWNMQGNSNDYWGANNGTDTAVTYGAPYGKVSQGANFNGSTSNIVIANQANFSSFSNVSLEAWVYLTAYPSSGNEMFVIRKGYEAGYASDWGMAVYSTNGSNGYIGFRVVAGNGRSQYGSTTALSLNTWYHLVATLVNGASAPSLYVNNIAQTISNWDGSGNYIIQVTNNPVVIGASSNGGQPFNGYIDEAAIWNKILNTNETTDLWNGGAGQTMCNGTGGPLCSIPRRHQIVLNPFEAKFEHFIFA